MRILVASPSDPYSVTNFVGQFRDWGHDVAHWDFMADRDLHLVAGDRFDVFFHVLVNDEVPGSLLADLKRRGVASTAVLFACDDDWRLPVSLHYAPDYDLVTTNDPFAVPIYRAKGIAHVRHVQYGVNPREWVEVRPSGAGADVLFIGQAYSGRPEFLAALAQRGIDVMVWGDGFLGGPLPHERLVAEIVNAKVVLNLSWVAGGPEAGRASQIKGRHFENAALGAFQLAVNDRRLGRYFDDDEIVTFDDADDCAAKIHQYLARADDRRRIARNGQARVLRDHTWARRWQDVLPGLVPEEALA